MATIKKDMLKQLPAWCKPVPFQIKGIAIKEACNAFWKAKGKPAFRTRKIQNKVASFQNLP